MCAVADRIGLNPTFPVGECPSVYELPASTPGFEAAYERLRKANALPSHVFKYGVGGGRPPRNLSRSGDAVVIGTYQAAAASRNATVNVTATPGFESLYTGGQMVDHGKFYGENTRD